MATSRTGTTRWMKVRDQRLAHDRDAGLTRCPRCRVWLDWGRSRQPNSPEADHIIPHKMGGADEFENTRTICRLCNGQLGGMMGKKQRVIIEPTTLDTGGLW